MLATDCVVYVKIIIPATRLLNNKILTLMRTTLNKQLNPKLPATKMHCTVKN